tara:strand:- start:1391 stop:2113 length:723 start_codon:yes stop_codon:yes gene_type:complete
MWDIREIFKNEKLVKAKLPESHRHEFLEKLRNVDFDKKSKKVKYTRLKMIASIVVVIFLIRILQTSNEDKMVLDPVIIPSSSDNNVVNNEPEVKDNFTTEKETIKKSFKIKLVKPLFSEYKIKHDLQVLNNLQVESIDKIKPIQTITKNVESVKVDGNALLFSLTHSKAEVLAYYKENNLSREFVLKNIEIALKDSNTTIDAENLLREMEFGLYRRSFKEKLLEKIKYKIKELSNTIVSN